MDTSLLKCQPKWKGTIVYENGVKVVKNPAEPLYGEWKFEIEKDLVIGEKTEESSLFERPRDIKTDEEGNIYILDSKGCKIHKFSKEGKYILSMGRKGEGPGELAQASRFFVDKKGNVYAFDISGIKITIFDKNGNFLQQIKIGKPLKDFCVDEDERIFGLIHEWDESGANSILAEILKDGKIGERIRKDKEGVSIYQKGEQSFSFSHPYLFDSFFSLFQHRLFLFGQSSEYKIFVIDRTGKTMFIFEKKEKKIPLKNKEKEEILSWFKNVSPELKKHIEISPSIPFFDLIFTDDMGRIYIKRMKSPLDKSKNNEFDIFSRDGLYLYKTTLTFSPNAILKGYLYDLSYNKEKEKYIITKYKVKNWKEFRNR